MKSICQPQSKHKQSLHDMDDEYMDESSLPY